MADAATSLGSGFDFRASRCISSGEFTLSLSQVELDLGYVPLLQIGLIFWKRGHRFSGASGLGLAAVASTISFRLSGRFEPRPGLVKLEEAYAHALVTREQFNPHEVYLGVLRALLASGTASETESAAIPRGHFSHPSGLSWTDFVTTISIDTEDRAGRTWGAYGVHHYNADDLLLLIDTLRGLVDGHARAADRLAQQTKGPAVRLLLSPDEDGAPGDSPAEEPPLPL